METGTLIEVVGAVVGAALLWLIRAGAAWLKAQTEKAGLFAALDAEASLEAAACRAVAVVEKKIVAVAKGDGDWDDVAKATAKEAAAVLVEEMLSPKAKASLVAAGHDVARLIAAHIESEAARTPKAKP